MTSGFFEFGTYLGRSKLLPSSPEMTPLTIIIHRHRDRYPPNRIPIVPVDTGHNEVVTRTVQLLSVQGVY